MTRETNPSTTVVFADLTGSTGVFEALGNSLATQAITTLTHWIGSVCIAHGGRVVKTLGDGVLAVFPDGSSAIHAVVELQRIHNQRLQEWPNNLRMRLQVGVASGEVIEVDGDCYGDAVNVASRLSDLSGADQIWATDTVISQVDDPGPGVRFLSLGAIQIRGKTEPRVVYRADWQEDSETVNLTAPAALEHLQPAKKKEAAIEFCWLDQRATFASTQMPVHLGRVEEAEFVVNDQRVSRLHVRVDWKNGGFVLTDLSSYGTWVRFQGSLSEVALRRGECLLHADGELALGAPFHDFTVPTVAFKLSSAPA
ncbi:adenylate/guanylate cyclase domain-containing protein [Caenimonas aquaedulcis]|uniref:Adenylate/guanylate cyclase domain-containing protein n=1 Tax=Caenimonas aquaedulcis TaxID=2793270 RepID=A0A931H1Q7_9BURK|nr:adenylate/guanylate cyclase domain-containing protein [Caenimonas aquaedulcis]